MANPWPRLCLRPLTSLILTLSFLAMSFSGGVLFAMPKGRAAYWTGWTWLGLGKDPWTAIHVNASILFVVAGVVHLVLNWRPLWCYVHRRAAAVVNRKWELLVTVVVTAVLVVGAIRGWPPFGTVMD